MRPFLDELLTAVRRPLGLLKALCGGAGAVYGFVLYSMFNTGDSDFAKLALFGAVAIATTAFALFNLKRRAERQRQTRLDELYGRDSSRRTGGALPASGKQRLADRRFISTHLLYRPKYTP